jgi:hypothetical protein
MSKVTGKNVIEYFEANREYFPSKFTVDTVKHHILNSDDTPAEILAKMERKIESIRANRLAKAQEQAVQEEAAKFNEDLEAKQELVNEVNNKAEAAQALIETEVADPVEVQNNNVVENIIKEVDLVNKTLFIKFARGSKSKFNQIKPYVINMLNEFKSLSDLFVKVYYKIDGNPIPKPTTFSLGNNIGMQKMKMLLDGKTYELIENVYDANGKQQELVIECSDTNKDNINRLTLDMITGIRITHKKNLFNKLGKNSTTIYCENGRSFYNYKINDKFKDCKILLHKLLKYQMIYQMKCLM